MARRLYSLVTRGVWLDKRFLQLSKPGANAQTLWLYLLTGDVQGPIPGLFRAGIGTLADSLGWSYPDTAAALAEIEALGMVERCALPPLLWLPRSIHHNPPTSPNVVRSWRGHYAELPECDLRERAMLGIREGLHGAFLAAFDTTFPDVRKPSGKPSGKVPPDPPVKAPAEGRARGSNAPSGGAQRASRRASKPSGKPSPIQDPRSVSPGVDLEEEWGRLAVYLRDAIASHTPRLKSKARPDEWQKHIRLMIQRDKCQPGEIRTVIDFAHKHPKGTFWRSNLLSGRSLRKQFDRLLVQAREAGVGGARGTGGSTNDWLREHAKAVLRWRDLDGDTGLPGFLADEDIPDPPNLQAVLDWLGSRP